MNSTLGSVVPLAMFLLGMPISFHTNLQFMISKYYYPNKIIPFTLVDNLPGGENLLGGGREGDDLRHGQENLWDEVNFDFQKKSKHLFCKLVFF